MQRISSSTYPLTRDLIPKLKQPSVWGTALVVALLLVVTGLWISIFALLPALLLLMVIHRGPHIFLQNFCEDAWIDDHGFRLNYRNEEIDIPFENVEQVTWHSSNNPPRAKIVLSTPLPHGSVFTFVPDLTQGRHQARKNVESLNSMIS